VGKWSGYLTPLSTAASAQADRSDSFIILQFLVLLFDIVKEIIRQDYHKDHKEHKVTSNV
jgi:hypothetical protein